MLFWQSASGFIRYLIFADRTWQSQAGSVGQLTDGPMALAQLGPSLYLVYKERNTRKLRMTSYNLALFNGFDAANFSDRPAPENNTSLHQWSPADFYVGHFAKKLAALQNDYQALGRLAMDGIEGEMHFGSPRSLSGHTFCLYGGIRSHRNLHRQQRVDQRVRDAESGRLDTRTGAAVD